MNRRGSFALAASLALVPAVALATEPVRVEPPRAFGYVVGDVLVQRIRLFRDGKSFEPAELPGPARLGVWLERRASRIEQRDDGQRWLAVDYQFVNAPREMAAVPLPAFELAGAAGAPALKVPAFTLTVAPLTLAEPEKAGQPPWQPDREAPTVALEPLRRRLLAWAGLAAAVLAAWPLWVLWRNARAAAALPFARAGRSLRRIDDTDARAWQALHRAFDAVAGRSVHGSDLALLFRQAPQLEPLRADIERFYRESAERFFGDDRLAATVSPRALCAACSRIERRHES